MGLLNIVSPRFAESQGQRKVEREFIHWYNFDEDPNKRAKKEEKDFGGSMNDVERNESVLIALSERVNLNPTFKKKLDFLVQMLRPTNFHDSSV